MDERKLFLVQLWTKESYLFSSRRDDRKRPQEDMHSKKKKRITYKKEGRKATQLMRGDNGGGRPQDREAQSTVTPRRVLCGLVI